jgi:hypothetical protein
MSPATPGIHIDATNAAGRQSLKNPEKKLRPEKTAINKTTRPKKTSACQRQADFLSLKSASEDVMIRRLRRFEENSTHDPSSALLAPRLKLLAPSL